MPLYCGIDLHSNNCMVSIIDDTDQLIREKRLPNQLDAIEHYLAPDQKAIEGVVVESTYNWYWLVDGLIDSGYPVHLANTLAIVQYSGLKYTDDASDARYLAHLLRLGILPTGYIYPKAMRAVRDLLRRRLLWVKQRTAHQLSLQSMINRYTGKRVSAQQIRRLRSEDLNVYFNEPVSLFTATQTHRFVQQLTLQIKAIERFVLARCDRRTYDLLTSVPGIGQILGMSIALETGPIDRFAKVGHYCSYARCVPANKLSNGKLKAKGNHKNGNRYLAMAFVEAAHYASIWHPVIKRYYQRKSKTVPVMVAKKAIANKLSRAVYQMLTHHQPFDIRLAFG